MPLHHATVTAVRIPRLARLAAIAAVAGTAGAVTIALTDDLPAQPVRSAAVSDQPATSPYFDLQANKAASMRALGRHLAATRAADPSRYGDIEANKARSQGAR